MARFIFYGFLGCCWLAIPLGSCAQFYPTQYRPAGIHWQQLQTPHFNIVFPEGADSTAIRAGHILERQYLRVQPLVDGKLSDFPVILNSTNDLSNGFVTPLHFRSEIELPPLIGKSQNPQSGNWLHQVLPHELVHAMQFSNVNRFGLGGIVRIFSPDMARSFYSAIPSGVNEGLAVYHETTSVAPMGGRGHLPFFTNQFNSVFDGPHRWSLGQMLQLSDFSRPAGRHYIGGYEFTNWLQKTYGDSTSLKALNFYIDLPFLGYGVALKHATGKWPAQLYHRFEADYKKELFPSEIGSRVYSTLSVPFSGANIRRPKWLDNFTLVFYGSFYNARSGFYRYELTSGKLRRLAASSTAQDYNYALSADRSELVYAYYQSSPVYNNTFTSELVKLDLTTGRRRQITQKKRLYAPVYYGNKLLALQTVAGQASNLLIEVGDGSEPARPVAALGENQIISVAVNPADTATWAVVARRGTQQALWFASKNTVFKELQREPDISFPEASVYDPSWRADGKTLLLTADAGRAMNIYEYDLDTRSLHQITNSRYNVFEASYSPDGTKIAFIQQQGNERLPVVLGRDDFYSQLVPPSVWGASDTTTSAHRSSSENALPVTSTEWKPRPYRSGLSWLKPRTLLPKVEEIGNSDVYQFGLSVYSNDLLQSQAYDLSLTTAEQRLWYDFTYRNKTFFPGFRLRLFSQPGYTSLKDLPSSLLRQERSFALSFPATFYIERNVFFSSITVEPEIRQSQFRFFELNGGGPASGFANFTIGKLYTAFNYKLQQNFRDLQPNSGLSVYSEVEHYFSARSLELDAYGKSGSLTFSKPTGLTGGLFVFLSPLRRWNQSLRLGIQGLTQSAPIYDPSSLSSNGFSEQVFPSAKNLLSFSARYTIPLFFPDNGGFLIPAYLSAVYLSLFENTVANASSPALLDSSRSVVGGGLRFRFRISNLSFDIGFGIGYEPSRQKTNFIIGDF